VSRDGAPKLQGAGEGSGVRAGGYDPWLERVAAVVSGAVAGPRRRPGCGANAVKALARGVARWYKRTRQSGSGIESP
jgi:hypothetical protein